MILFFIWLPSWYEWKQTWRRTIHNLSPFPQSSHLWLHPLQWKPVGSQLPTRCLYCWKSQRMPEVCADLAWSPGSTRLPLQAVEQQDLLEANYEGLRKTKWVLQTKGWVVTYQESMGKGNVLCVWRKWSSIMVLQWFIRVWETSLWDGEIPDIYLWFCSSHVSLNPKDFPFWKVPKQILRTRKDQPSYWCSFNNKKQI